MDDIDSYLSYTLGAVFFLFIAVFFKLFEIASGEVSESRLKHIIQDDSNNTKAKKLLKQKRNVRDLNLKLTSVTGLGIIASSSFVIFANSRIVTNVLRDIYIKLNGVGNNLGHSVDNIETVMFLSEISMLITSLLTCYIAVTFGIALPRKIALKNPEPYALNMVGLSQLGLTFFAPFNWLVMSTMRILLTLLKIDPDIQSADLTEDELRSLVDEGNEKGTIDHAEKEMINNIFDFDERTIDEIMTHRTDIIACSKIDEISKIIDIAINDGVSRIPVYDEDIDDIIGVIYAKDLLNLCNDDNFKDKTTLDFMRSVLYVPESAKCVSVFKTFKTKKTHFAVVVDEYGGTSGLVTMEDILESIVGNIQDEYDNDDDDTIIKLSDTSYIFNGSVSVEEVAKILNRNIDIDENYDTLRGLISSMLEKLSVHNEHKAVEIDNVLFVVLSVEDRKIMNIRAEVKPKNDDDEN